jgi:hypothetical protein
MRGVVLLGALALVGCGSSSPPSGATGTETPASRFVTSIVSYDAGPCAGWGQDRMPEVVEGPPLGGGASEGSTDVLSLGNGGELVLGFDTAIVDGPGFDFIVFENPFRYGSGLIYDEPGEVSVSDDGVTWQTFSCQVPCATPACSPPPYGACGGWHVVYANWQAPNPINPLDPSVAGGDAYDLAAIGVAHARYVRIQDRTAEACNPKATPGTNGFDLDAIGIVNAAD